MENYFPVFTGMIQKTILMLYFMGENYLKHSLFHHCKTLILQKMA